MSNRKSATTKIYRASRANTTLWAAARGPSAYGQRKARRHRDRKPGSLTRAILRALRLTR